MKKQCTAVVLAAGTGSRMKSQVAKQFLLLEDKPLIWYALNAVEHSQVIDRCILVTGEQELSYVQQEIVEKYEFQKVDAVIAGGEERYLSVLNALEWIGEGDGYVFIHDGARPFLTEEILERTYQGALHYRACVAAMPSKDTVKLADREGMAVTTPDRRLVWKVQTPQVFERNLIIAAYRKLKEALKEGEAAVTDDASVVELFTDVKVKLVEGSYRNLKVTTPEDLLIAQAFLGFSGYSASRLE